MFNLILFGPPGSGKGTQSLKIAEKCHFAHISTGDIFRNEIRNYTELGMKVQSIIERGELVPDELLIEILESALKKFNGINGYIFDGFPRTLRQTGFLDNSLARMNEKVSLVIALDVNEQEVIQRLLKRAQLEGRKDDTEDVIHNRMSVYHQQTKPLMDHYAAQGKLEILRGVGTIDDIFSQICALIDKHL